MQYPRLVVAAPRSGEGKTTLSLALMAALTRRHQRVQGFKVGPDYIDPAYYALASGRAGRNVDAWMGADASEVMRSFCRGMQGADIAVVEGVMGYYDGKDSDHQEASTWHVADLLQSPTVLVVDGQRSGGSLAAVVWGFQHLVEPSHIAGVVVNHVNERHYRLLQEAIGRATGLPCYGYLPFDATVSVSERALGILPAGENPGAQAMMGRLAALAESTLDIPALVALARGAPPLECRPALGAAGKPQTHRRVTIAVAQDQAFNFYYPQNFELLADLGADIVPFSPLAGEEIPGEAQALYLGGGFPEIYAQDLSAQQGLLSNYRRRILQGIPTLAECGGYMFLAESLRGTDGRVYPMVGAIPHATEMCNTLQAVGYRTISLLGPGLFGDGSLFRGHEFHYSRTSRQQGPAAYSLEGRRGTADSGYRSERLVAGYAHFYLPSNVTAVIGWLRAASSCS